MCVVRLTCPREARGEQLIVSVFKNQLCVYVCVCSLSYANEQCERAWTTYRGWITDARDAPHIPRVDFATTRARSPAVSMQRHLLGIFTVCV